MGENSPNLVTLFPQNSQYSLKVYPAQMQIDGGIEFWKPSTRNIGFSIFNIFFLQYTQHQCKLSYK
jgi:hypothetical protein